MRSSNPRTEYAERARSLQEGYDETSDTLLKSLFDEAVSGLLSKQAQLDAMFDHVDAVGLGATFANRQKQYAIVLPDASYPGFFRCQYFDSRGFFSHSTRPTLDQVIYELCEDGYREVAPSDTLTLISQTPEWEKGMAKLAVLQAVQEGMMSWEAGNKRCMEIDREYDQVQVA